MGKKKQSNTQEGLLIIFVTICIVLVAATLIIAFDEATAGMGSNQGYFGGSSSFPTLDPSITPPTARPHTGSGQGKGSGHDDEHEAEATVGATLEATAVPAATLDSDEINRQATLAARSDAQQQGLAY